jgi:hypothetical protein
VPSFFTVEFGEGPIGIKILSTPGEGHMVGELTSPNGQAARNGCMIGDCVEELDGEAVSPSLDQQQILEMLAGAARPLTIKFSRMYTPTRRRVLVDEGGLGIMMDPVDDGIQIVNLQIGSQAHMKGMQVGDYVSGVNDVPLSQCLEDARDPAELSTQLQLVEKPFILNLNGCDEPDASTAIVEPAVNGTPLQLDTSVRGSPEQLPPSPVPVLPPLAPAPDNFSVEPPPTPQEAVQPQNDLSSDDQEQFRTIMLQGIEVDKLHRTKKIGAKTAKRILYIDQDMTTLCCMPVGGEKKKKKGKKILLTQVVDVRAVEQSATMLEITFKVKKFKGEKLTCEVPTNKARDLITLHLKHLVVQIHSAPVA